MNNILLGALGEQSASRYLRTEGYKIIAANYKTYVGELDIVAEKDDIFCFVEVKTRQKGTMLPPSEAVDYRKQENIKGSAAAFLNSYNIKKEVRYDIVEVIVDGRKVISINHIKNGF